jgi:hypothetical protein
MVSGARVVLAPSSDIPAGIEVIEVRWVDVKQSQKDYRAERPYVVSSANTSGGTDPSNIDQHDRPDCPHCAKNRRRPSLQNREQINDYPGESECDDWKRRSDRDPISKR